MPEKEERRFVDVSVLGKTFTLDAGRGCFWDDPVFNVRRTIAYVVRNRGSGVQGFSSVSIARITESDVADPVIHNDELSGQGSIDQIKRVSEDGRFLLMTLHYICRCDEDSTEFDTRPVFLDVDMRQIREIEFPNVDPLSICG